MPRTPLNRELIVTTAITMADRDGLHAVTLRGIAKRLGVHVTSLYNHVDTKEALLVEMGKALVAESKLPCGPMTWQVWIGRYIDAVQALACRHPGAFHLFQEAPAQGERAMASLEAAINAFEADGFDLPAIYCAIKAVNAAALGLALDRLAGQGEVPPEPDFSQLSPERYPGIHRLVAADDEDEAATRQFLVDTLISGFAANRSQA